MKRRKNYLLSAFFVVIMILTVTINLWGQFDGGSGTKQDPWQVAAAEHLDNIRNYLGDEHTDKHFIQTEDIDLDQEPYNEAEGWEPIGVFINIWHPDNKPFKGTYNGNGFLIKNLYMNRPHSTYSGLFGHTDGALLKNIELKDNNVIGSSDVGAIVGVNHNSEISNCRSNGIVRSLDFNINTGGLVGHNYRSTISNCYTTGDVTGCCKVGGIAGSNTHGSTVIHSYTTGVISGTSYIGGLVGENDHSYVYKSFATGTVTGSDIGGLVGDNYASRIMNSYSTAEVIGTVEPASSNVGGLAGRNRIQSTITNCYAVGEVSGVNSVGGLIGQQMGSSTNNSYWNISTTGQEESAAGKGRTSEMMKYPYCEDTFVGWDFEEIWISDVDSQINEGYPYLREEGEVSITEDYSITPVSLKLSNYPNPFNPYTNIHFTLSQESKVKLIIVNTKGQKVRTLLQKYCKPGEHIVLWNGKDDLGRNVASGVYFYSLQTEQYDTVQKMLMLK